MRISLYKTMWTRRWLWHTESIYDTQYHGFLNLQMKWFLPSKRGA